jgi:hypothetical protein
VPNLVLVFLFWLIFFDLIDWGLLIWAILGAGFFLDLFSIFPLGVSIVLLGTISLLIKRILKGLHQPNSLSFGFLFLIFFLFYNFGLALFAYIFNGSSWLLLNQHFLFHFLYCLIISLLGFKICLYLNSKYPKFFKTKK